MKYEIDAILIASGEPFTTIIEADNIDDAIDILVNDIEFCKFAKDNTLSDIDYYCNGVAITTKFNKPDTNNPYKGKSKKKYSVGYALATQMRADRTYTVCVRLHVNGKTSYCPTPYHVTKAQWSSNKDFSGARAELRDEILTFLNKEIEAVH